MGILTQLLGIITLALPISIIGSNFIDERTKAVERKQAKELEDMNTPPGEDKPLMFPVAHAEHSLEAMDFFETELHQLASKSSVMISGLLQMQQRIQANQALPNSKPLDAVGVGVSNGNVPHDHPQQIAVSATTVQCMNHLTSSMKESLTQMGQHLN